MRLNRIRDIPQFSTSPQRIVEVGVLSIMRWIKDQESSGQKVDLNPAYQRGLVWSKAEKSAYVEYILRGGPSARNIYFNCQDFFSASVQPIELVDGKQRLNSLVEFTENKFPVFDTLYKDFKDKRFANRQTLSFHINTLDTKEKVAEWFIALNATGKPHNKQSLAKARQITGEGE